MITIPPPSGPATVVSAMRIVRAVHYGEGCTVLANLFRRTMVISLVARKLTSADLEDMVNLGHTRPGATVVTAHARSLADGFGVDVTFDNTDVLDHEIVAEAIRQLMPREMDADARRAYRAIYEQLRSTE